MTDLVNVAVFGTLVEADLARLYLEGEGIYAVVAGNLSFGYEDGPPRLMVLDDDYGEATKLLRNYIAREDAARAGARSGRGRTRPG